MTTFSSLTQVLVLTIILILTFVSVSTISFNPNQSIAASY